MKPYTFKNAWHDFLNALRRLRGDFEEHVARVEAENMLIPEVPLPVRPEIIVRLPSDPKPLKRQKRRKPAGPGLRSKADRKHPRRTR